jgi:uncharacterized protein YjdB
MPSVVSLLRTFAARIAAPPCPTDDDSSSVPGDRHFKALRLFAGVAFVIAGGMGLLSCDSSQGPGRGVASVAVTPPTAILVFLGETVQLSALAADKKGREMAGVSFTWASSADDVATVDASGLVTAVAGGSATISATADGVAGTAAVTVAQVATSVTVTPETATLAALGATVQLAAAAEDAGGHAIPDKAFTWSSSQETVATVDASGLVTSVANGDATISATADGETATAEVTVAQELAQVAVTPGAPILDALGATVQLAAAAQDANGYGMGDGAFTWASSDEDVATVSPSGLVTAVGNGTASISATTEDVDGHADLTVAQKATAVALTPEGASISGAGGTQQFGVAAWDSRENPIPEPWINATWTSLNPHVATIDPASGAAAAHGAGQVPVKVDVDGVVEYALLTVLTPGLPTVNLWAELETGISDPVEGIWGTSANKVFVAAGPRVLHFDGNTWSSEFQNHLYSNMGVWGSSDHDVYVVGHAGQVLHYDGTSWSQVASGMGDMLSGVWGTSPRDIFAVSWDGTIVHCDGEIWTSMGQPTPADLHGLWGTAATDVYTVGQQVALHYDGTAWNDISTGVSRNIEGLWGSSGNDIYAGGVDGNVFHYNGAQWTRIAFDVPMFIDAAWGTSPNDIYFAGADSIGNAAVLHYDGTHWWTLFHSRIHETLLALWGAPTGELFAVGTGGTVLEGFRGGTVSVSPSTATLSGSSNQLQMTASAAVEGSPVSGVGYFWDSSDEDIATVDHDGWVTGLAGGTATITATAFGGASASATVTVNLSQGPPVAIIDSPGQDTVVALGESVDFRGTASDPDGTIASHIWDFGDGHGSSVEDPGPYTYADTGTYKVTYRVTDNDGASSPAASVMVRVAVTQPVMPGVWHGSTTGMSFDFTVNSGADGITQIVYTFSGLTCGGTTLASGSVQVSRTPPWPISNREFTITGTSDPKIDLAGTFGDDGATVSGTWHWLTCSGTWTGSR